MLKRASITLIITLAFFFGGTASLALAQATSDTQNIEVQFSVPSAGGGIQTGGSSGPGPDPAPDPGPGPDTDNPPIISNVAVVSTENSATITWSASDDKGVSTSSLEYGLTTDYGTSGIVSGNYTSSLSNLLSGTTYYYKITVSDTTAQVTTKTGSFSTSGPADTTPPTISNIGVNVGVTSAVISWQTNEAATGEILYGTTAEYGQSATDQALRQNHSLALKNLISNRAYHFKIVSTDAAGNSGHSSGQTFTTLADTSPPPNVTGLSATATVNGILVKWSPPNAQAVPDFSGVTVVKKVGSAPTKIDDGTTIYSGSNEFVTDTNVFSGTTYYYLVLSFDTSNNYSTGVSASATYVPPPAGTSEVCDNGSDDDNNGFADCADPACASAAACQASGSVEVCGNGLDDNSNGFTDCEDSMCVGFPACATVPDGSDQPGSAIQPTDPGLVPPAASGGSGSTGATIGFLAGGRALVLSVNNSTASILAGYPFTVTLTQTGLQPNPQKLEIIFANQGRQTMVFNQQDERYYVDLAAPLPGNYQGYIEVTYQNSSPQVFSFIVNSLAWGNVVVDGIRLSGVTITLLDKDRNPVNVGALGQTNPLTTNVNGTYGWVVPNGRYFIEAKKIGYYDRKTAGFGVNNNVVNKALEFIAKPLPILEAINPASSTVENVTAVTKQLLENTKVVTERVVQKAAEVADDPLVEETASDVVAPTVVAATAIGTAAFISWLDLLPLLRYLFLQPLMLLGLRRRQGWGQVYNTLNKQPVDLATLRLFDAETGKLIQTKVSDKHGRFAFVVKPGKYKVQAQKTSLKFPSVLLANYKSDGRRTDIYHGEVMEIDENGSVLTMNIPLDPMGEHKAPRRLVVQKVGRTLQVALSWLGILVTTLSLYISPKWYVWILLGLHILLFFVFRRLAIPPKIKSWGVVFEDLSKHPIGRVVARLFNSQFNKLVATQITDHRGRYYFLAGDDKYYVTYDHNDYSPYKSSEVDLKGKESENITLDVGLKKGDGKENIINQKPSENLPLQIQPTTPEWSQKDNSPLTPPNTANKNTTEFEEQKEPPEGLIG